MMLLSRLLPASAGNPRVPCIPSIRFLPFFGPRRAGLVTVRCYIRGSEPLPGRTRVGGGANATGRARESQGREPVPYGTVVATIEDSHPLRARDRGAGAPATTS